MRDATVGTLRGEVGFEVGDEQGEIPLSRTKPHGLTDAPEPAGMGHYGLLDVAGDRKLAVMVDVQETGDMERVMSPWTLYVGNEADGSLADAASRFVVRDRCCGEIAVSLSFDYGGETGPLDLWIEGIIEQYDETDYEVYARWSVRSARVGYLPETGEPFILTTRPWPGTGFDGLGRIQAAQDLDGSGDIRSFHYGERLWGAEIVLIGSAQAWEIDSISPAGKTVQLARKEKGVLTGKVVTFLGADPVAGATVRVWPGGFEAETDEDGAYSVEVYEGRVWKVLVAKEGYIPAQATVDSSIPLRIGIRSGRESSYNVDLAEIPEQTSGTATLIGSGSFYAALGLAFRNDLVGDFIFDTHTFSARGEIMFGGAVCACAEGQRGLVDIGDQGSIPLSEIRIPPFGYNTRSHATLEVGRVYVVKAREGLEGRFVVFRVDSMTEEGIEITYSFR